MVLKLHKRAALKHSWSLIFFFSMQLISIDNFSSKPPQPILQNWNFLSIASYFLSFPHSSLYSPLEFLCIADGLWTFRCNLHFICGCISRGWRANWLGFPSPGSSIHRFPLRIRCNKDINSEMHCLLHIWSVVPGITLGIGCSKKSSSFLQQGFLCS